MLEQNPFGLVTRSTGGMINGATSPEDKKTVLDWQSQENTNILNRFSDKVSALPDDGLQSIKDSSQIITPEDYNGDQPSTPEGKMRAGSGKDAIFGDKDKVVDYIDKLRTTRQAKDINEAIANPSFEYQPKNLAEAAALGQARVQAGLVKEEKTAWQRTVEMAQKKATEDRKQLDERATAPIKNNIAETPFMKSFELTPGVSGPYSEALGKDYSVYAGSIDSKTNKKLEDINRQMSVLNAAELERTRATDDSAVSSVAKNPKGSKILGQQAERIKQREEYDRLLQEKQSIVSNSELQKSAFHELPQSKAVREMLLNAWTVRQQTGQRDSESTVSTGKAESQQASADINTTVASNKSLPTDISGVSAIIASGDYGKIKTAMTEMIRMAKLTGNKEVESALTGLSEIGEASTKVFKSKQELASSIEADKVEVANLGDPEMSAIDASATREELKRNLADAGVKPNTPQYRAAEMWWEKATKKALIDRYNSSMEVLAGKIDEKSPAVIDGMKSLVNDGDFGQLGLASSKTDGSLLSLSSVDIKDRLTNAYFSILGKSLRSSGASMSMLPGSMSSKVKNQIDQMTNVIDSYIHNQTVVENIKELDRRKAIFRTTESAKFAVKVQPTGDGIASYAVMVNQNGGIVPHSDAGSVVDSAGNKVQTNEEQVSRAISSGLAIFADDQDYLKSIGVRVDNKIGANGEKALVYWITPQAAATLNSVVVPPNPAKSKTEKIQRIHIATILQNPYSVDTPFLNKQHLIPLVTKTKNEILVRNQEDSLNRLNKLVDADPSSDIGITERANLSPDIKQIIDEDSVLTSMWSTPGAEGVTNRRMAIAGAGQKWLLDRSSKIMDIEVVARNSASEAASILTGDIEGNYFDKRMRDIDVKFPDRVDQRIANRKEAVSSLETKARNYIDVAFKKDLDSAGGLRVKLKDLTKNITDSKRERRSTIDIVNSASSKDPQLARAVESIDMLDQIEKMLLRLDDYIGSADKKYNTSMPLLY